MIIIPKSSGRDKTTSSTAAANTDGRTIVNGSVGGTRSGWVRDFTGTVIIIKSRIVFNTDLYGFAIRAELNLRFRKHQPLVS